MNLLADEGVDRAVVERLRREGHDVLYMAELSPSLPDEDVLQQANERGALLVTADKDFGEFGIPATPRAFRRSAPPFGGRVERDQSGNRRRGMPRPGV